MSHFLAICTLVCTIAWPLSTSAELAPDLTPEEVKILEELKDGTASVDEVGRQLSNPVGTLWNLTVQNNLSLNNGDLSSKDRVQWVTNLQPALPIPLTERWNLITRPVISIVSAPIPTPSGFDRETGLGDMVLLNLLAPADPRGLIWGAGSSFLIPTATDNDLGSEKFSMGPAAVGLFLNEKWVGGALVQQWWSVAGDDDRRRVSAMNLQYFLYRFLPNGWQVGLGGPIISANWSARNNDDRWTVPIGLGVARTFRIGRLPFQMGFEASYAVVHPDNFGQRWNFRLTLRPVIPGLIQDPIFGR
jgi:hypothetical protein